MFKSLVMHQKVESVIRKLNFVELSLILHVNKNKKMSSLKSNEVSSLPLDPVCSLANECL